METPINASHDVDVLIAGGGVAGSAAAAALSQLGLDVLIVEPNSTYGRRLAGELIHPPGIQGLRELGLLDDDDELGAAVNGFAIFPGVSRDDCPQMTLPYDDVEIGGLHGMAIEHQLLKNHLLAKAQQMSGVTAWVGGRVVEMELGANAQYTAVVQYEGEERRVSARLILGADGPMSQLRKKVGITHQTQRYSGMMGVEVEDTHLPRPGFGNIFLNPEGVAYAYGIGDGRTRVMFEVLRDADADESIRSHLSFFPDDFRTDIEAALAAGKPLAAANYCIIPEASVKANFALIGDARGCCHPLTASGITAAVKDALLLRDALRESHLEIKPALRHYARVCGRLELIRRSLAEELREAFLAHTPEDLLLHQCIFSYWANSPAGRVRSMALLSSLDSSIFSLAMQFATVALHAFRLLPQWINRKALWRWHRGLFKMLCKSVVFQQTAVRQWVRESYAMLTAAG